MNATRIGWLAGALVLLGAACGAIEQATDGGGEFADLWDGGGDAGEPDHEDIRPDEGGRDDAEAIPDAEAGPEVEVEAEVEAEAEAEAEAGCTSDDDCDDEEPCNGRETCGAGGACRRTGPVPTEGAPCERGALVGVCHDGTCVPVTCGDGRRDAGEECDDGNALPDDGCEPDCTYSCHGDEECADENPCTSDGCGPFGSGRRCGSEPAPDGTACEPDDPCLVDGSCTAGACSGRPRDCSDGDPCTADVCDPTGSSGSPGDPCVHPPIPRWYRDADGDTWGDESLMECANSAPPGFVERFGDCCDSVHDANPDQEGWFAEPYGCGSAGSSFDWNCDAVVEPHWTAMATACRLVTSICSGEPGWCPSDWIDPLGVCIGLPPCGTTGGWVERCLNMIPGDGGTAEVPREDGGGLIDGGLGICVPDVVDRRQLCH